MTTQVREHWSLLGAAARGCVLSAVLLAVHFLNGSEPYPSQTIAGQIAYWAGYLSVGPLLFVIVAAIRNAFTPRAATPVEEQQPSAFRNFLWPARLKAQPGGVARFGRVLHWLFAMGALAFVISSGFAIFVYEDMTAAVALPVFGGGSCLLVGRALRYILAGE